MDFRAWSLSSEDRARPGCRVGQDLIPSHAERVLWRGPPTVCLSLPPLTDVWAGPTSRPSSVVPRPTRARGASCGQLRAGLRGLNREGTSRATVIPRLRLRRLEMSLCDQLERAQDPGGSSAGRGAQPAPGGLGFSGRICGLRTTPDWASNRSSNVDFASKTVSLKR